MTSEPGRPSLATPAPRWEDWGAVTHPESGAECSAAVSRLVGRVEVPSRPGQRTRRPRALARMDAMARRECGNRAASPHPGPLAMIGARARSECGGASPHPGHRLFPPSRTGVVARRECGNGAATPRPGYRTWRSHLPMIGVAAPSKCACGAASPRTGHRHCRPCLVAMMGAMTCSDCGGGAVVTRTRHHLCRSRLLAMMGAAVRSGGGAATPRPGRLAMIGCESSQGLPRRRGASSIDGPGWHPARRGGRMRHEPFTRDADHRLGCSRFGGAESGEGSGSGRSSRRGVDERPSRSRAERQVLARAEGRPRRAHEQDEGRAEGVAR